MQVRVLYFAAARDAAGLREETVELPQGATVEALLNELARLHPGIAQLGPALRVAVDESYQEFQYVLRGGEEVALIPPVAGGSLGAQREGLSRSPRRRPAPRPEDRGRRSGAEG